MYAAYAIDHLIERKPATPGSDVLDRAGLRMQFSRDEEIYGQDEKADLVYRVVSGGVRTSRFMSDGRRQIGDFYLPGDVFGLEAGDKHLFCAEALSNTVVVMVKRSALAAADPQGLGEIVWSATQRALARAQEHILVLGRKNAVERVASFLLSIAARRDGRTGDLPMSRQDMADYLGLTIETVSRMLTQLQATGDVKFEGLRHFSIRNPAALAEQCD